MTPYDFPHVTAVRSAGAYRLWLQFSDGVEGHADLSEWLAGPVFGPLREPALFAQARREFGTVSWPNGADFAPEALYERVVPTNATAKTHYEHVFGDARRREVAQCAAMPEISRFFGIVIRMFWREYDAPHFHAEYGEYVASIEIMSGAVTTRRFSGKALQLVNDWRERHHDALLANWERMRRSEPAEPIPPLE